MFEVKVTVELPGVPEALTAIAQALAAASGNSNACAHDACPIDQPAIQINMTGKADTAIGAVDTVTVSQAAEVMPVAEAVSEPAAQPEPVPEPAAQPEPAPEAKPAKSYTFAQISNAGAALCTKPGMIDKLVQLLNNKYGVAAITMIDKSRYNELAEDLIALGAVIGEG